MSFDYVVPVTDAINTTTFGSKPLLVKAAKIDVAAGSGGATATDYNLGIVLPKGAQVLQVSIQTTTAISGGTISAATIAIKSGSTNIYAGINVFATGSNFGLTSTVPTVANTLAAADQTFFYNLTLTGTGPATAGVMWITVFYVV